MEDVAETSRNARIGRALQGGRGPGSAVSGARIGAGFAGAAFALIALAVGAVTIFASALAGEPPSAYGPEIEFAWSAHSWAQARVWVAVATGLALGVGLLVMLSAALLRFAATGLILRRRPALVLATAPPAAVLALLTLFLTVNRADARVLPDCQTFRFDRAAFRSTERNSWQPQAVGLDACGLVEGRKASEAQRLLGAPEPRTPEQIRSTWLYHGGAFELHFQSGRVQEMFFSATA